MRKKVVLSKTPEMSFELSFIRTNDNGQDNHKKPTYDKRCN